MSATVTHEEKVAADQAAIDDARDRAIAEAAAQAGAEAGFDTTAEVGGQTAIATPSLGLSFATGQRGEPDYASVKISGALPVDRDLYKGQGFYVRVVTFSGELVTEALVACTNLAFPDKTDKDGVTTTERVHTLKVEGGE